MNLEKETLNAYMADPDSIIKIAKALNSPIRLEIFSTLIKQSLSMTEIAEKFYLPMSSVSMHIHALHDAGLISVKTKPGLHGSQRVCGIKVSAVHINLFPDVIQKPFQPASIIEIPIGSYSDCDITAPCGIVNSNTYIDFEDYPYGFYSPDHINASLIWFTSGMLEYHLPTKELKADNVYQMSISFEICAEAPGYNNDWPSDITVEINHVPIVTFTVKGDFGGRKGLNNPSWWNPANTQFGELKHLVISNTASYLGEQKVSDHTIDSLHLKDGYFFTFRLKVDPGSKHVGGMNLFGKSFGDYSQDIIMKVEYM